MVDTIKTTSRWDVRGRGVLVTGAGRGLGRELALELGRAGARLALVARTATEVESVAVAVRAAGGSAWALPADVGDPDPEAARRLAGAAQALVGPIELVVHAAATLGPTPLALLHDSKPAELDVAFQVNALGPFRLTQALLGPMLAHRRGTIVLVTSDAAVEAYPTWGAYGASKAALEQLGRVWAKELEESGVRVVAVDPGEMDTRLHAEALPEADRTPLADPARVARWLARVLVAPNGAGNGARLIAPARLREREEVRS